MPTGEISRALAVLFEPGQVIEVRAISDEGTASGYFNDPSRLVEAVVVLDTVPAVQGIYVTLNEVDPALLSRRANRIKKRLGKKDATTADSDILRRRWFPVDVDPIRPSGVSSSEEEHRTAISQAEEIAAYLAGCGWPAGVLADSGNGAHVLYRIDLPNDDESRDLVKRCLEVLDAFFSTSEITIDTANHNAARIWKLYGTASRKGDHTEDRPHRRALILDDPGDLEVVPRELLEQLASSVPVPPVEKTERKSTGRGKAIDLGSWLVEHGIGIAAEKPYQDGTIYVLDECPFSGDHRDGAYAIQFGSGAIHAGCHHNSCGGGSQRWPDLREKYDPRERRGVSGRTSPGRTRGDRRDLVPGSRGGASPPVNLGELPGHEEALAVLQHGDPKQAMFTTFALDHEGDEVVAECMILSLASRSVLNTNGLHVSVTGESGKGKSHAFSTMLRQVPERFRLEGAMSNKALFYLDDLQPGSVIVLDDRALSEDMAEILKGVTTSFRKPFIYRTVSKDRRAQVCTIPERCVWWVAKVEGAGDDQVFNRMLTCWIDDTEDQDARVLARILARDQEIPGNAEEDRPEVLVCRVMWEIIGQRRFHVVIPFSTRIRFQASANRRNPEMLLDLVKTNTVLRFMQRDQQQAGGVVCLTATREDFGEAVRLYGLLNGTAGGQETKLTKREADLLAAIQRHRWPEFTTPMLQKATGWSSGNIHKCIHGYTSRGTIHSGLLEKCPAISYCDRTVVTGGEDEGVSMRRRTNAYAFDQELFGSWCAGGAVWLDDDQNEDQDEDGSLPQTSAPNHCVHPVSQCAEVFENGGEGSDSSGTNNNKNKLLCTEVHFRTSPDIQHHDHGVTCDSLSVCDPEVAEVQKQKIIQTPPIDELMPEGGGIPLPQTASATDLCGSVAEQVNPRDFSKMSVLDWRPCSVCGRKESWYSEKVTPERRADPTRDAQRLCKRCYEKAAARVRATITALPGTIDLSQFEEIGASVGRCSVCDLAGAVWIDRKAGIKLCEACYQREKGPNGEAIG